MYNGNKVLPYTEVQTTEKFTEKQLSERESHEDHASSIDFLSVDPTRYYTEKVDTSKKWMLRPTDTWRIRWDLFIMACAVYDCFIVPLEISMMHEEHLDLFLVTILIDVVFAMDIVFNFRTTYYDHVTGDEVFDPHKISHHYIYSGHIFIDILATVPFDHIIGAAGYHNAALKLAQLLKLFHVMRLGKIINNIRLNESYKIVIRLAQIILNIIMYVHCCACAWRAVVEVKEKWRPPSEGAESDYYEAHLDKVYSFSLYHAVYMWAGVEINPQTNLEMFFLIAVILLGSIIRAILFGKMAVLMDSLSKESQRIGAILDTANTAMKNMHLPEALQYKICDYLLATQHTLAKQEEFEQFINLIPPSHQSEVSEVIYTQISQVCPVLRKFPTMFKPLIRKLQVKFVYPETDLIIQGDQGDKLFYLVKGLAEVEVIDEQKVAHSIKFLRPGQYFGELALLYNTARTATVRSAGYSTVGELDKVEFIKLMSDYPDALQTMKASANDYKDPWKSFVTSALRRISYFKDLSEETINLLMYTLHSKSLDIDSMLFVEGEMAQKVYIVAEGNLNLYFEFKTKHLQSMLTEHFTKVTHRDSIIEDSKKTPKDNLKRDRTLSLPRSSRPFTAAPMKLEVAKAGNILCASQAILRAEMKINCIATEPTQVLYITTSEIEDLMKHILPLKGKVEAVRAEKMRYDSICGEVIKIVPPIDFTRSFLHATPHKKRATKNTLKLKNSVISFLIRKRLAKISGLENIKSMVLRLKAMMKAEAAGYVSLARKIASGEVNPEAVEAIGVLNEEELKIPLLTQFAVKVQGVKGIASFLEGKMVQLAHAVEPQTTTFEDIHSLIGAVRGVVERLEKVL
mmetsp:Transcript_14030/g.26271  ORF Transcript_14030/g.26271 Transcript_14030/m.26271 type:complete len:855 (+) Transcript_14030:2623-5187(+)